jgi:tetratricopeptide (TPR) repeat protein
MLWQKGLSQHAAKMSGEALATLNEVSERYGGAHEPTAVRTWAGKALVQRGTVLSESGATDEAIAQYEYVVDLFGDEDDADLASCAARALNHKAIALGRAERHEEAVEAISECLKRFGHLSDPLTQPDIAMALDLRLRLLATLQRHDDVVAAADEVLQRLADPASELHREVDIELAVSTALLLKASALHATGSIQPAIGALDDVIERFDRDREPRLQQAVQQARQARKGLQSS